MKLGHGTFPIISIKEPGLHRQTMVLSGQFAGNEREMGSLRDFNPDADEPKTLVAGGACRCASGGYPGLPSGRHTRFKQAGACSEPQNEGTAQPWLPPSQRTKRR